MAIRDIFKISRKTFVNPTGWIDYESLKTQNKTIWEVLKNLFSVRKPLYQETFEEAQARLSLTEEDIQLSIKNYRLYALLFLLLGLIVLFYSFYLLFRHGTFTGWLLGIASSGLFFSQAFRFDFWAFQIKRRKLGATFAEWKNSILGGKDSSQ